MSLLVEKHEKCECGHCRCEHREGYLLCLAPGCRCSRYRWPGRGADLPPDHPRALAPQRPTRSVPEKT